MMITRSLLSLLAVVLLSSTANCHAQPWRDKGMQSVLKDQAIEASFQGGMLYQLKDLATGEVLLSTEPADLPAQLPVFGSASIDLDSCTVKHTVLPNKVFARYSSPDGDVLEINWRIEPGKGDLIFNSSITSTKPVEEMRAFFFGGDIKNRQLVWIHGYGTGNVTQAPYEGPILLGDPVKDGSPSGFSHPLVALFEGKNSGWFIEGREPRVGPACLMISGTGEKVNLGMVRKFLFPEKKAHMYEVRIRTYNGSWQDAVDPYVEWLEKGAGFVALDKLPRERAWINDLKTQAYIGVGDYQGLEELARRVNPKNTFVGRQAEFRHHGFDMGYPDYRVTEGARKWAMRARELGFHVGMHFNVGSCSAMFPDLVERFKPGMQPTGKKPDGTQDYEHIYEGSNSLYRVSAALKDWRDYLVDQIKYAVEAGVDVIYLDEAMAPHGRLVVGDTDGYHGTFLLMQEIYEKYPHVAIQTEQFNTLSAKYGKIALSQMPLGHPLSGYIFRRFVKVVPEGVMYSPTENALMDAFDSWGFMLPGANVGREESWLQITEAFHKYDLVPDSRLPREEPVGYSKHYTSGILPEDDGTIPADGKKLFGYRGTNGVTAYFEKHPTKRGLVVYEPGQDPKWFGTRYSGIRTYSGPGLPAYFGFREYIKDWLIYDGDTLLGFDPKETYWFDENLRPSQDRFHVYKVPDDFAGVTDMESRTSHQEVGKNDDFFFVRFTGHGELGVYVPEGYDTYLNGQKIRVDGSTRIAAVPVNASYNKSQGLNYYIALSDYSPAEQNREEGRPGLLIAFRRIDVELTGKWKDLPLYTSPDSLKWITSNNSDGFVMSAGSVGRFVGRIPDAKSVRLQGSYKMNDSGTAPPTDGVVRLNGVEVLRVPHGGRPAKEVEFDADISAYAGQYVLFEFGPLGSPGRGNSAEWLNPRFEIAD